MTKSKFYLLKDERNDNPYGSPLNVKDGRIKDLSGRYQFSKVKVGDATCHRTELTGNDGSLDSRVGTVDFILHGNEMEAYQGGNGGQHILVDEITREQAMILQKGIAIWDNARMVGHESLDAVF